MLLRKYLKFENSGTTNRTQMKLSPDMYHLNNFYILKNEGVDEWAGEGRIQKITKTCHKINKISTLTSHKNSLQNAMKVGIFYCHPNNLTFVVMRLADSPPHVRGALLPAFVLQILAS